MYHVLTHLVHNVRHFDGRTEKRKEVTHTLTRRWNWKICICTSPYFHNCEIEMSFMFVFSSNLRNPSHIRIGEVWQHPNNFQWDKKLVKKLTTIPFRSLTNAADGVDWYVKATVFVSSTGLKSVDFVVLGTREETIPVTETIIARILQIRLGWPNMA